MIAIATNNAGSVKLISGHWARLARHQRATCVSCWYFVESCRVVTDIFVLVLWPHSITRTKGVPFFAFLLKFLARA